MRRASRLELERIVWTAVQGAITAVIGAGVLGLDALQAAGVAAVISALGALSSLVRRRLAAIDRTLGVDEPSG